MSWKHGPQAERVKLRGLRKARLRKFYNLNDVTSLLEADGWGITTETLSNYERCKFGVPRHKIPALERVLETTYAVLARKG